MSLINIIYSAVKFVFNFRVLEIRQAWRTSIVCIICLFINRHFLQGEFPAWAIVTAVVCLQSNFGATLKRVKQRVIGTILGCALALSLTLLFPDNVYLSIGILLVSILLAIYNSLYNTYSYTYTVFFFTLGLIAIFSTIFHNGREFAILRIEDVALGALVGTLGSLVLWPDFARKTFKNDLLKVVSEIENYFIIIRNWVGGEASEESVYAQKIVSATSNQEARNKISEIYYELGSKKYPLKEYESFILSQERIHYSLLNIYNTLQLNSYEKKINGLSSVSIQLETIQDFFRMSVARLPLSKRNIQLHDTGNEMKLLQKLEKQAEEGISHYRRKENSLDHKKFILLLEKLVNDIKLMNEEINKIYDYYHLH
ncbi:FUSC family protein [Pigmentibacter sp. JX0631]|uniref:FUSC family protein n=1 Tax=Pigmentibacter sp. JX0631 TaxID=2976982 RepID=UPI0024686C9C|nr:FUSC family protein [Pigmentibacter sp. JX0631]WGL60203.1 FUSC family protein [Pigmentibacter sp. JX0631]